MKNKINLKKIRIIKKEHVIIPLILIGLLLVYSYQVTFFDMYYLGNDLLTKIPPWNHYPPEEFGNYNPLLEDQTFNTNPYAKYLSDSFISDE